MFLELANHNEDLKRLLEKGYAITEDHGYLVIRDIPYLDDNVNCQTGAIVMVISDIDGKKAKPNDHQIYFAGSHPCEVDGTPIKGLGGGPTTLALTASRMLSYSVLFRISWRRTEHSETIAISLKRQSTT